MSVSLSDFLYKPRWRKTIKTKGIIYFVINLNSLFFQTNLEFNIIIIFFKWTSWNIHSWPLDVQMSWLDAPDTCCVIWRWIVNVLAKHQDFSPNTCLPLWEGWSQIELLVRGKCIDKIYLDDTKNTILNWAFSTWTPIWSELKTVIHMHNFKKGKHTNFIVLS